MPLDIQTKIDKTGDYEFTIVVNGSLQEDEAKKVAEKFIEMVKKEKGELINVEHWGKMSLAYPIKHQKYGYYSYVEFRSQPEFISKIEQEFNYDENLLRYLTFKLDKHSLAYNLKRRNLKAQKKAE